MSSRGSQLVCGLLVVSGMAAAVVFAMQPAKARQDESSSATTTASFRVFQAVPQDSANPEHDIPGRSSEEEVQRLIPRGETSKTMDPTTARVARDSADSRIIVMSGAGSICTYFREPSDAQYAGGFCANGAALANPATITTMTGKTKDGGLRLTALVPDSVVEMAIEMGSDLRHVLPIMNNMVDETVATAPIGTGVAMRLVWKDHTGHHYDRLLDANSTTG